MNVTRLIASKNFITVNKDLIKKFGLCEAVLLGCLCSKQDYWESKDEFTEDGYFFCTAEQFEEETTLSPYQQRKALKTLEDAGIITTKTMGIPAKKYFKVVNSKLLSFLTTSDEETLPQETEKVDSNNIKNNDIKDNNIKDNIVEDNNSSINNNSLKDNHIEEIKEIVDYLNIKSNKNYRYTTNDTQKYIKAKLNEGFTINDFKKVIDNKCTNWLNNKEMEQYLRPSTLFGNKFEQYLNQKTTNSKPSYQYRGYTENNTDKQFGIDRKVRVCLDEVF